jgi:hypothetical protein
MDLNEVGCGLNSSGSGLGPVAGYYELGNEASYSIKGRELLCRINDYQLVKYLFSEVSFSFY